MRQKLPLFVAFLAGMGLLIGLAVHFALQAVSSQVEHANVAYDVSPDGRQIVFSSADANLYLFNLNTRQVQELTRSAALETEPAFSPNGKWIVYSSRTQKDDGAGIYVRSVDGKLAQELTHGLTTFDSMPSFSPDGKQIAFVRAARHRPYSMGGWIWDKSDVYLMNRNGSGLRQVTRQNYYQASRPHFIRNSKEIVFTASGLDSSIRAYLFTVPADGSLPPTKFMPPTDSLSHDGSSASDCAIWSSDSDLAPNGNQIVFISDRSQSYWYDLWVTDLHGGKPHALNVTHISSYNQEPVLTPDSDHVYFLAGTEQNASSRPIFSLWEVNTDGSHAKRIADSNLFTDPLHWKPKP